MSLVSVCALLFAKPLKVGDIRHLKQKVKIVPTAFIEDGYRFKIYLNDHSPAHCHVQRDDKEARIALSPVAVVSNEGFQTRELKKIVRLVEEHHGLLLAMWDEYHESR